MQLEGKSFLSSTVMEGKFCQACIVNPRTTLETFCLIECSRDAGLVMKNSYPRVIFSRDLLGRCLHHTERLREFVNVFDFRHLSPIEGLRPRSQKLAAKNCSLCSTMS